MKKVQRKILVAILPILIVMIIFLIAKLYKRFITGRFLPCWFNLLTGYLCPGCGGTRSFYALIHGDIISSFRYNAFVPIMAIFFIILYVRLFLKVLCEKNINVFPQNDKWIYVPLILFLIYFITRNIFIKF